MSAIQPGDLIFYESPDQHVALYVGGGQIIHAPHAGDVVRYDSLYYWNTSMWRADPKPFVRRGTLRIELDRRRPSVGG